MQPTRWQILEILKHRGQATVDELAKELGITLMAVRLHLVVLERDGLVSRSTVRTGPGRPTLIYRLTDRAEDAFPKAYDGLANDLIAAIRREYGPQGVERLCVAAGREKAAGLRERLGSEPPERRIAGYVQMMTEQGHLLKVDTAENGFFVHRYSCPYYRVARVNREVCVMHRKALADLMEAEVDMVSCLLDGDLHCSHLVRLGAPAKAQAPWQAQVEQRAGT